MNDHFTSRGSDKGELSSPTAARDIPEFELSDYLDDLAGIDVDEAAKIELLTILRDILVHFVQVGFDLKDVDLCGQLLGDFTEAASSSDDEVES
ncbi:hypothetical protein [Devosia sp. XK-2]|uniref:hypothetical protein n=1 Tax=Devosia sp. XK-2 TaxID=3126689 RepID=UPI0030CCB0D5